MEDKNDHLDNHHEGASEDTEEKKHTDESFDDASKENLAAEDDNKANKLLFIAIAIVIGLFALFFTVRFFYDPGPEAVTLDEMHRLNLAGESGGQNYAHNGFSFVYFDNLWYTQVLAGGDLIDIPLHFGPKDLREIDISGIVNKSFQKKEVYISFDPTDEPLKYVALSSAELSLNLAKGIGVVPIAACSVNETSACSDRPIVTCEDPDKAVIMLDQTNSTGTVELDGNCASISGEGWELVKATDRFLLQWYRVMK